MMLLGQEPLSLKSLCRSCGSLDWDGTTLFRLQPGKNGQTKFNRCLTPIEANGHPLLVVFCHASRLAFGTCAYTRWRLKDGKFDARFIAAKSRVAPLKELTVPRLELQAAVLASRLSKTILEESRFKFQGVRFLTDRRVLLAWIEGESRSYKPFVSSRVAEVQTISTPSDWSHCPSNLNVADDVAKCITPSEMNGRWLSGPECLQLEEELWPKEKGTVDKEEVYKERREVHITCEVTILPPILKCEDYSSWKKNFFE